MLPNTNGMVLTLPDLISSVRVAAMINYTARSVFSAASALKTAEIKTIISSRI